MLEESAENGGDSGERDSSIARLVEVLPIVVFRLDRNLRHLYVNPAIGGIAGWPPQRFIGRTALEAGVDPALWRPFEAACRQVLEKGAPRIHDFVYETPSGPRHFETRLFPERGSDGRVESIVGVTTDWSERWEIEDELRASEDLYRALIDQVKNYAIFAVDLEGRATTWNEGVQRVLGWSREEFIGLPSEMLYMPEDIAAGVHREELRRAAEEGSVSNERWLRRKDGTAFFASGMTSRVVDAAGHVVGFSRLLRDRTAWKQVQEEREALLESERSARQEAEQANRLKDEFLATLSHELRSPLNAIVGWLHIARRYSEGNPELERALDTIERNARAQTQIINDLLDMSRIMTGKVHLDMRQVNLHQVIEAAVEAIRAAAEAKCIELDCRLDPNLTTLRGDPNRLQQVLWNLLTNAVKFTPAGGSVSVTLEQIDSSAQISVQDTGVGIAPAFLPYVFDRFRQADASTTRRYGGLGLGLSIVKSLVEMHGGSVRVKSAGEGQGATFIVTLPLAQVRHEENARPERRRALTPEAALVLPRLDDVRTLIVDDEVDTLLFVARLLEERGARVVLALDAQQALDVLAADPVDILISDIGMPGMDGYGLIARVRASDGSPNARIPAIAVTAYARAEDRQRLLLAGYQMHITKPVEPHELIAGVASLVGVAGRLAGPEAVPRESAGQQSH